MANAAATSRGGGLDPHQRHRREPVPGGVADVPRYARLPCTNTRPPSSSSMIGRGRPDRGGRTVIMAISHRPGIARNGSVYYRALRTRTAQRHTGKSADQSTELPIGNRLHVIPEGAGCCQALFSPSSTGFGRHRVRERGQDAAYGGASAAPTNGLYARPCSVQTCRESKTSRRCAVVGRVLQADVKRVGQAGDPAAGHSFARPKRAWSGAASGIRGQSGGRPRHCGGQTWPRPRVCRVQAAHAASRANARISPSRRP